MAIDTRNKVISQSNVKADTAVTFIATADGGNIVGSENIMLDGAGNYTAASDRMLCPFSAYPVDTIPAYCNIIQAGSKYDLTVGSVTTAANERFVGTDATAPVVLNYASMSSHTAHHRDRSRQLARQSAYVKAHIQEGRNDASTRAVIDINGKNEDLTYSEILMRPAE